MIQSIPSTISDSKTAMNITQRIRLPQREIALLCQRYRVRELALFGSALREDFKADSDVDLLVEFESDARVSFVTLSRMQRELSSLVQRSVDLVPKAGLKPRIRRAVLASAEVIYAS